MPAGKKPQIKHWIIFLMVFSAVTRALIAGLFELGNDEVYYWTYAAYPALSYFDHPPMVGWLIRLFTLNLHFQQEFFVRLASVLFGTFNIWLMFRIGKRLKDELTGWYAALLFSASLYGFVITGIFILPDTPQMCCWLLALLLMLDNLPREEIGSRGNRMMILTGILLGLGLLSKYTTIFLWAGMAGHILLFNRRWLRSWSFYLASLIMIAFFSIVLIWNAQYNFISFAYQGGRSVLWEGRLGFGTFLTEAGGEILYHNPVNFILILLAVVAAFRSADIRKDPRVRILLLAGLPLIAVFLGLSLFRNTLPHWSGPGYTTLIPLAALWIRELKPDMDKIFRPVLVVSLTVMLMIVGGAILQTVTGFIQLPSVEKSGRKSRIEDFSLQVYGWKQLGSKFGELSRKYEQEGSIREDSPLVTYRWFPAANLEYYVARPAGKVVLAAGELDAIHHYAWINNRHGGFRLNTDAWYITSSIDFRDPVTLPFVYYREILPPDTVQVIRSGRTAYSFYVYRLINLQARPRELVKE